MNDNDIVQITDFRFDSLRKYMRPLYSELSRNEDKSREEKHRIKYEVIPQFFRRLRTYRDVSILQLSERYKLKVEHLEQFERGELELGSEVFRAYNEGCHAQKEFIFFSELLREFLDPSIRSSKVAIASDALKRFGVVMPGVDYKSLNEPRGKILSFQQQSEPT